jgi:hypothetical protein
MSRYMLIMRSTPEAEVAMQEANIDFSEVIESMGRFNEELIKAGVMLAGEGLTGPEEGFVVDFNADPPVVTDGPYTEAKELFNGFWILDVSSKEEAKQWAQKVPLGEGVKLEVRRVSESDEFPMDNPWIKKEIQWRADLAEKIAAQGARAGSPPGSVRVEHLALLGDLDVARAGQLARDVAGVVHQVAPVIAADLSCRVGRTDGLGRTALAGEVEDRRAQLLIHAFSQADMPGP